MFRLTQQKTSHKPGTQIPPSVTPPSPRRVSLDAIWRLTWPQVIMMILQFFIGVVDVYVAGLLGSDVQAVVGMLSQAMLFFLVVAIAASTGATAAVGQSLGARRPNRARRYASLALWTSFAAGSVIFAAARLFSGQFVDILHAPPEIRPMTLAFLDVFLLLLPVQYALVVSQAVFRANKMVFVPLFTMAIITTLNALFNVVLALGIGTWPGLGPVGIAWSTFISVTAGCLWNLVWLVRAGVWQPFDPLRWCWIKAAFPFMFRVAWPQAIVQIIWHSGYLGLFAITASLHEGAVTALAGMASGTRVESLLFLPAFALNMTASIMVSHALGAGKPEQAKKEALTIWMVGIGTLSLLAAFFWPVTRPTVALLTSDPPVIDQGVSYLRYNLLAIPFTVTSMILAGVFGGAGATVYNLVAFGISAWLVRLPTAYVLGHHTALASEGIWASMLISQVVQSCILAYFFFRRDLGRFAMRPIGAAPSKE